MLPGVTPHRPRRRILHTSDLHLNEPGETACDYFEAVVDLAARQDFDLVIIAGDLFDRTRIEDSLVSFVVKQLRRLTIPVIILPGNHDCLVPGSVLDRAEFRENGGNIHLITAPEGETLKLTGLGVSIWGKCINSHDNVLPLGGIPRPENNGNWNIAVAHGYFVSTDPPLFPSYHITGEEIITSGWDYIALGHIPTFQCISSEQVTAYYSGSPSVSGTVAIVELDDETGVQVTPFRFE